MSQISTSQADHAAAPFEVRRFRDLIEEILHCCQARTAFLSRKFDLPQAEVRLIMLFQGERYLTVKGIAQRLDVAKSRVTKIVQSLVEKKLVDSVDDPRDARIRLISLTLSGQRKADEIAAFAMGLHERILAGIDLEERKGVMHSLDALRASMENVKKELV